MIEKLTYMITFVFLSVMCDDFSVAQRLTIYISALKMPLKLTKCQLFCCHQRDAATRGTQFIQNIQKNERYI